jgi:thiamine-monophosphate kinase
LNICITVFGEVPAGQALRRDDTKAGDELWVSHPVGGGLGDARLALEGFRGTVNLPGDVFNRVRRAMESPQPRVALGQALRGVATSAIDLSDGLAGDIGHVLVRSRLGATLRLETLPRSADLAAQPPALQQECLLHGGDDYELLFSAAPGDAARVQAAAVAAGVAITRIGHLQREPGVRVLDERGQALDVKLQGFDHFRDA